MSRIRLTTSAAEYLRDQLGDYLEAVRSSGQSDDTFEAAIDVPALNDWKPHNDVRVSLCFSDSDITHSPMMF